MQNSVACKCGRQSLESCHITLTLESLLVSEMTYYVSSGTLNPTHSLTHSQIISLAQNQQPPNIVIYSIFTCTTLSLVHLSLLI